MSPNEAQQDLSKNPGPIVLSSLFTIAQPAASQTLLLRWNFDEASDGSVDAMDTGAAPATDGVLFNTVRTNSTPADHSLGAVVTTGAAAGNLRYVIATDANGEVDKLDGLAAFTLTAWINVQESPAGNRRVMSKQFGAPLYEGFTLNVADSVAGGTRTANNFGLRMFIGGSTAFAFDSTSVTIDADNKWVFIAVSYDGNSTANNVRYYKGDTANATAFQSTTTINAGPTLASTAAFAIGYTDAAATANTAFPGFVDDVRVYSGVLSDAQIEAVRKENLPSTPPPGVELTNIVRAGTTVTFEFVSQSGKTHQVEYKDDLNNVSWQPLTTIPGTGSTVSVTNENATATHRFYRVATQ